MKQTIKTVAIFLALGTMFTGCLQPQLPIIYYHVMFQHIAFIS